MSDEAKAGPALDVEMNYFAGMLPLPGAWDPAPTHRTCSGPNRQSAAATIHCSAITDPSYKSSSIRCAACQGFSSILVGTPFQIFLSKDIVGSCEKAGPQFKGGPAIYRSL
ncbi:hypothetical protein [Mesorhizobium japonicum]|uniref:hypothetical protein n=1 Tax=Mesorhizobium japonicum TaxID=2066070 RepID=UPI003B5C516B